MAYATPFDLASVGLLRSALGSLTDDQISAALENASSFADSFFRNRYGQAAVPLLAWDNQVTQAVAQVAALRLIRMRGYDPDSDSSFQNGYNEAIAFFNAVQRQQASPLVTVASTGQPGSVQPNITSYSVVNLANGCVARNRGW